MTCCCADQCIASQKAFNLWNKLTFISTDSLSAKWITMRSHGVNGKQQEIKEHLFMGLQNVNQFIGPVINHHLKWVSFKTRTLLLLSLWLLLLLND